MRTVKCAFKPLFKKFSAYRSSARLFRAVGEVNFDSGRTIEAAIRDAITTAGYQVVGEGKSRQPGKNVIEFTPDKTGIVS